MLQKEVGPSSTAGQHFRWLVDPHGKLQGQTCIVAVQEMFVCNNTSAAARTEFCCAMVEALPTMGTAPPAAMTRHCVQPLAGIAQLSNRLHYRKGIDRPSSAPCYLHLPRGPKLPPGFRGAYILRAGISPSLCQ